jgi:integrating conjugative element protein (TIGR03746 family)
MARYTDALAQANWTIKCLLGVVAAATTVAVIAMFGWRTVERDVTLHIPPHLSAGAQIHVGRKEVPASNVYLFAFYIWQQLNRWSVNGQHDYGTQIYKLQAYFTPACQQQLINDMTTRAGQGELDQRIRSVMEIPGLGYRDSRVMLHADGSWNVLLDTQIIESSRGVAVKDAYVRYPLHVVRYDVDRELNPWQLAIDCYTAQKKPERLDPQAVAVEIKGSGAVVQNTGEYAERGDMDGGVPLTRQPAGPLPAVPAAAAAAPADGTGGQHKPGAEEPAPATLPRLPR